ncbi:hypothetical protein [Longimicrobium sp.]|uniref:hypothetical protein n=1 Tax=Longimicrobium sp. TaxID=2029185 RepID=UPI002E309858|nr:hypothetical protein [Longimicrobium sp.]HEX6037308.1 hypothetical protein [Longimicrobium sp.]
MRSIFPTPLLLLAALAAVPAAAQVEGRYDVVSINGRALPTPSPMQRWVTIDRAAYWFEDGHVNMSQRSTSSDGQSAQRVGGTYVTVRDSLYVLDESGRDTLARFCWERQGDTLRLHDRSANVYQLAREAVVAGDPWSGGAWNAVQLNGRDLPAPWTHISDITAMEVAYAFGDDGRVTMRIRSTYEGRERTTHNSAPYRVEGDRLTFFDGDGEVAESFVWTLRDSRLRLVDLYGHVYLFEPAAATAP